MKSEFSVWIEKRYLEWQLKQGGRKSITEFAEWLGFAKSTVVQWMNDQRKPNQENALLLAEKLGMEVYDTLGLLRPDPLLFEIQKHWEEFSGSEREEFERILDEAEQRARVKREKATRAKPAPAVQ